MNIKSPAFKTVVFKTGIIFNLMVIGSAGALPCNAQAITGRWKEVSSIEYYKVNEGTGEHTPKQHPPFNGKYQVLEIKADQSFTSTQYMNWLPGEVGITGKWSLTGDQLKTITNNINIDYAVNIYTIKLNGKDLVLSLKQNKNPAVLKIDKTYSKME